jgi:hypothetical protein
MKGVSTVNYTASLGVVVGSHTKLGRPDVVSPEKACDAVDEPQL